MMPVTEVYLNVYDLSPINNGLRTVGLGMYHSGIQLNEKEFTFGGHAGDMTGVMEVQPKENHPGFRESILLGSTSYSNKKIYWVIDNLKEKFPGNSYHVIRKNCNTFTNAFSEAILHKPIPAFVNRMANGMKMFLQIDDFFRMRPYDPKYETDPTILGAASEKPTNVFQDTRGIQIG